MESRTVKHWIDRVTAPIAPRWTLQRQRARLAAELVQRHYEAASAGRRTQTWKRSAGDANSAIGPGLSKLREVARDLVRNNPYAESALNTIVDHTVGWGIVARPSPRNDKVETLWKQWAESTDCDADERNDFAGLQKLVMRTVVESGEVLVRRRLRRPSDGLAIPIQIQVLEPDFLDTSKDVSQLPNGGRIIHGVEFDAIGTRVAFWLFRDHPGSSLPGSRTSTRVPAESVTHVYDQKRAGQVRGVTWFAPVLLRFKDFDEFEDATLMKQKIAACLAVITSDVDGSAAPLGTVDAASPNVDSIEPGMIINAPPGRTIEVIQPPSVREYSDYTKTALRAIATGLGVSYEDLTGDYGNLPFSAARMSRIRHWSRVEDWRWRLLAPQFLDPVWAWVMEAAQVMGQQNAPGVEWTPPPMPMLEPDKEGLAAARLVRAGIKTQSEAIRECGYDPERFFAEMAADNKKLDALGIILDSDARKTTQSGQLQGDALPKPEPVAAPRPPASDDENDDDDEEGDQADDTRMPPVINVDARTTVHPPPPAQVNVDARTTIAPTPAANVNVDARTTVADGAVRVETPVTVADTVQQASGRKTIERDGDGRITAIVEESTLAPIVRPGNEQS